MAYTKKLIGNVTKGAIRPRGEKRIQYIADTVDENLTNIETAMGQDVVLGFGTEPGAVASSTSGAAGTATTASRSDHNHDLGAHGHSGATDGGALTAYQADLTATSTLADLGVAAIDPAFSGVLAGITNASTLAQLLAAIDSHTHGG